MLKPFLTFAALGVAGIVAWKAAWIAVGFFMTLLKIVLVVFLLFLAYKLFQNLNRPRRPEVVP